MIANKGKANREVVQTLIKDMSDFSEYVTNELKDMTNQTIRLGDSWRDPQYDQFSTYIAELTSSLEKDIRIFEEAIAALKKKLAMYD